MRVKDFCTANENFGTTNEKKVFFMFFVGKSSGGQRVKRPLKKTLRTPACKNFGQIDFQKFRFFGIKSAIFDSDSRTESKNELGVTQKVF